MVCRREGRSPDRIRTTRRRRDRPGGRIVEPGNERRRGHPLQAAMWPSVVVVHAPLVENDSGLRQAHEQPSVEQFVSKSRDDVPVDADDPPAHGDGRESRPAGTVPEGIVPSRAQRGNLTSGGPSPLPYRWTLSAI